MNDHDELITLTSSLRRHLERRPDLVVPEAKAPPRVGGGLGVLDEIRAELGDCTRCKLHPTRKNIVFGVGNPAADLVFVGEAPGHYEDVQGEPFVGDAGQLLNKMIAAMGWDREDVYIANILKCLRYNTPVQLENGSWERIGRLVAQRYSGGVMSVDEHGHLVSKRVIGWYASPLGGRRVYKLSFASAKPTGPHHAATYLTEDHEVMSRRGWIAARDLAPHDEIAVGQGLSAVARDVVIGSLLGDASINRSSAYVQFVHSRDQDEWVRLKAHAMRELRPVVFLGATRAKKDGPEHLVTHARTRASRAIRVLRRSFYPDGTKRVPEDLRLTGRMFATWFLDDGYTRQKSPNCAMAEIACHAFTEADIDRLRVRLHEDLRLDGYVRSTSPGRIHFSAEMTERLSQIVAPYCPPCLRHKLHPRVAEKIPFDPREYEAGVPETLFDLVRVEEYPEYSRRDRTYYCIDVADTHNFVTTGGVVHNCRPPGNRNPEADEIAQCEPFLIKQVAAIKPRMIVALGKFAAQCLLRKPDTPISALRGKFHAYQGIQLMPTYHPAYLLRTPSAKRVVWEDLQLVIRELERLGVTPPRPPAR